MRIVQLITRPQRRGAEIFALQLSENLIALGHEVWVIAIFKGEGAMQFSGHFERMDRQGSSIWDFKGFKKLAKLLDTIHPDIVQANASDTLRYSVGAKFFSQKGFVLVYRNANTISAFIKCKLQRVYNQMLHSKVDAVVSVSEHTKRDYLSLFNPKKIISIPIGIDPVAIKLKMDSKKEEGDYLLFIGSLVQEKDPVGMLEIFGSILEVHPNIKLKFLGSGPLREILRDQIEKLDLKNSVVLIGNQSNIFPILSSARALVMPSKIEGLPGVILEAMCCNIPVIAYDVGGIPEVVENNKTGWCIEAGNSEEFSNAIIKVLNLPSLELDRITSNGKELVLKNYQMEQIAKEFEMFYRSVIANAETKNK